MQAAGARLGLGVQTPVFRRLFAFVGLVVCLRDYYAPECASQIDRVQLTESLTAQPVSRGAPDY